MNAATRARYSLYKLNDRSDEYWALQAAFDRYIAAALPGNRARMLRLKEHYLTGLAAHKLRTARSVEDVLEAKELQLQAAECCENPSERAEIRRRIEEVYADPQSLIPARRSRTPRP